MKDNKIKKVISHLKEDQKEFVKQIKDDQKLTKQLKKRKKK